MSEFKFRRSFCMSGVRYTVERDDGEIRGADSRAAILAEARRMGWDGDEGEVPDGSDLPAAGAEAPETKEGR